MKSSLAGLAALAMTLPGLAGCSSSGSQTTTVLAAASLTDVFTQLGTDFEEANPGQRVEFSFGSSSTLAVQIAEGSPADVFASADEKSVGLLGEEGKGRPSTIFATNQLQIAVPAGNPGKVEDLSDFADPALRIAYCAEQAPCGKAALKVFAAGEVTPEPDSLEPDVRATLTKVTAGEVDAALVYRTDVMAATDKVEGIAFAQAGAAKSSYPIVDLQTQQEPNAFVAYVLSPPGQAALAEAGFGPAGG